jgi:hypothetical protein
MHVVFDGAIEEGTGLAELGRTITDRLSLIRYQLAAAAEVSRQPAPIGGIAINGLQDAVEAFLRVCVDNLHVDVPSKSDFVKVFDAVNEHQAISGAFAGYRSRLDALNTARVGFNHHGNLPSPNTLERARVTAYEFLDEACPLVFELRLEQISLNAFIRDDTAREFVAEAERRWASGEAEAAMTSMAQAFDRLLEDYETRKIASSKQGLFTTEPAYRRTNQEAGLHGVVQWLRAIDERCKLLAFGIDVRRHAYFRAHTPSVRHYAGGRTGIVTGPETSMDVTDEAYERCHRFLLDTAVALGADDYDHNG